MKRRIGSYGIDRIADMLGVGRIRESFFAIKTFERQRRGVVAS